MSEDQNINLTSSVSSAESSTQTNPWSSFSVEMFMFDDAGMLFYTGLSSYSDFIFVLSTLTSIFHFEL